MIRAFARALLGCAIVALVCALMCVAIIALPLLLLGTLLVEVIEMLLSKATKKPTGWRPPKDPPKPRPRAGGAA